MSLAIVAHAMCSAASSSHCKIQLLHKLPNPKPDWIVSHSMPALIVLTHVFNWSPRRHFQPEPGEINKHLFDNSVSDRQICATETMKAMFLKKSGESHSTSMQRRLRCSHATWFLLSSGSSKDLNFPTELYCLTLVVRFRKSRQRLGG